MNDLPNWMKKVDGPTISRDPEATSGHEVDYHYKLQSVPITEMEAVLIRARQIKILMDDIKDLEEEIEQLKRAPLPTTKIIEARCAGEEADFTAMIHWWKIPQEPKTELPS